MVSARAEAAVSVSTKTKKVPAWFFSGRSEIIASVRRASYARLPFTLAVLSKERKRTPWKLDYTVGTMPHWRPNGTPSF